MVDPDATSMILGAITAGAADGAIDAVKQGAKDLVTRIRSSFSADDVDASADLSTYSRHPSEELAPHVAEHLERYGILDETEIIEAARTILSQANVAVNGPGAVAAGSISNATKGSGSIFTGGQHNHYSHPSQQGAVQWEVTHYKGIAYELRNCGTATAYDVRVEVPGALHFEPPEPPDPTWFVNTARLFRAGNSWQTQGNTVYVYYSLTRGGEEHAWNHHLPRNS